MELYKNFAPTACDSTGLNLPDQQHWYLAPVSITRDSNELSQSNFQTTLDMLGGESETVQVHRFGHWGPGWFEIILIKPDSPAESIGNEIEDKLADYPVLDQEDYSQREFNSINEYWGSISLPERINWLQRYDCSIFAARRDSPWDIDSGAGDWPYVLIQL